MRVLNYPYTRHFQRYEFVLAMGYLSPESIIDIGSGSGTGSILLTQGSKEVISLDPQFINKECAKFVQSNVLRLTNSFFPTDYMDCIKPRGNLYLADLSLKAFYTRWKKYKARKLGSAVCIEVIEHVDNPKELISLISKMTNKLFITTPLSDITKTTTNKYHVQEFSKKDFEAIVQTKFKILKRHYQHGNLNIDDIPTYLGDSINHTHTVQMLWCKKKGKINGGKK